MTVVHEQDDFAVEEEGLPTGFLMGIVASITLAVAVVIVASLNSAGLRFEEARLRAVDHTGYPLLQQTRTEAEAKLGGYEMLDAENGIYRIPIERAMELVAREAATGE